MKKTVLMNFVLPLLVPMACAGLLVKFSVGPSAHDALRQLESDDPRVRERAMEWLLDAPLPSTLDEIYPHLYDNDLEVAEEALKTIRRIGGYGSLEELDHAFHESELPKKDIIEAYSRIRYPQTLPYVEKHLDHADPEIAEAARESIESLRTDMNQEIVFFGLGNPIYNQMGYMIYSQAVLFPEGREMVEGTSTEPEGWEDGS